MPSFVCLLLSLATRRSELTGANRNIARATLQFCCSVWDKTFPDAASGGLGSRDQTCSRFPRSHLRAKLLSCETQAPASRDAIERVRTFAMKVDMNTSTKKKPITVRLDFHDDRAKSVCIVGTFNNWDPKTMPMLPIGPGQWIKELALSPGIYEYQYVVDGRWINDPHAEKSTPNPLGGRNSVLVVEQHDTQSETISSGANRAQKFRRKGNNHDR